MSDRDHKRAAGSLSTQDTSTAPRIGMLFPHLILGGGETAMMEVVEGLRERFPVTVCALARRPMTVEPSTREELLERFGEVRFVRRSEELVSVLEGVELLLWYGMNPFTPRALEAASPRPASIRVVHTSKREEGDEYHARWSHVIDAVCCVSPEVERRIPGSVFIPNTVSPRHLAGPAREFFAPGRPTLGFLGRLFAFKNVDWLIEHSRAFDYNLLIQGLDTDELTRGEVEALARRHGVDDRVRCLDAGRDVGTLLKSVDALAIVSEQEGLPMVLIEAGMVGTPVIATRVGALPELFAEEILFVDFAGSRPSEDSMRRALAALDAPWGARLERRVRALCDRNRVVDRYAELILRLIGERRAALGARATDTAASAGPGAG